MAENLGLSRELIEDTLRTQTPRMGRVPSPHPAGEEALFKAEVEEHAARIQGYKESLALERARPPEKVPLILRSLVLQESQLSRTQLRTNGKFRFLQTYIGTSPEYSITPVGELKRCVYYYELINRNLFLVSVALRSTFAKSP